MEIKAIKTKVFKPNEDLFSFIENNVLKLKDGSVLVVTSKIVSLSEGRVENIEDDKTRERLIKAESEWAMRTKYTWLTIKDNMVMSSAGIDESNANGKIILLPHDSFLAATKIRTWLKKKYQLKNIGVIITDSRLLPLRAGIVGIALGYAGFKGVRDYRGKSDIFGRHLKLSITDVADSLATAAVLVMGEGSERQPLAIISGAPVEFRDKINRHELDINIKEDLYLPLFQKINKIKLKK